jgi:small subunit ribosomal protein S1
LRPLPPAGEEKHRVMSAPAKNTARAEFEALLNAQTDTYRKGFDPGSRVRGVVLAVGPTHVTLDVNAKREGLIAAAELRDETGKPTVRPGDAIEATFVGQQEGAFIFTTRLGAAAASDRSLAAAHAAGLPVEGVVQSEINGGYEVTVAGQRAFCPYSQISLFKQEGAVYVGQKFAFLIQEYDPENRNLVVSRRAVLEKEREALREALQAELAPGQVRTGTVSRIADFGVFVDLGGIDGLIPLKEIAWERGVKPADVVKPGDTVQVLVREIDNERGRISLSLRAAKGDPWDDVVAKYPVGSTLRGRITRIEKFGAFAEIVPGVEGLIPIGKLGHGRRLMSAREAVSEGQELELQVETVEPERRRIGLKPVDDRVRALQPGKLAPGKLAPGEGEKDEDADAARRRAAGGALGSLGDVFGELKLDAGPPSA